MNLADFALVEFAYVKSRNSSYMFCILNSTKLDFPNFMKLVATEIHKLVNKNHSIEIHNMYY